MIKKILIANRGEIAVRIIRACKELGIISAAVYSEADKTSLHILLADESYFIGAASASESYLNKSKIINLAKIIGADAIHPGYGFLSENAEFIKSVEDAGITFIGPSSNSVKMMGSKTEARKLMKKNNVPIVPGSTSPIKNLKDGLQLAEQIGYPVLLKASAGGGGKGMRKISSEKEFADSLETVKREAFKAFADDDIYIEKYIENPRHIEVQILADNFGNYVHLFERECSIQRRHQKIIEESPSSFVDYQTRLNITAAAVNAAKACGYHNAGTVEFLMDADRKFYFLEMNTRIQVEHPVTELITGKDLVKEQILVASGLPLSFTQDDLKINCHAMEARIYAEDPENNFLPSTGNVLSYEEPAGNGVRVDSGIRSGSVISVNYDPLLAKLICCGENRITTIKKLKRALDEFTITGLTTNLFFLTSIMGNEKFKNGEIDINFLEREMPNLQMLEANINQELEIAASILAAKIKSSKVIANNKQLYSRNNWFDQNYE